MKALLAISALCTAMTPWVADASVASVFPFTGRLTDSSGLPLNADTLQLSFTFYDQATGGTNLWTQAYSVSVRDGQFSVDVGGDASALGTTPSARGDFLRPELFDGDTFVEVQIASDPPMSPRLRVGSMAYAMRSAVAEDVDCVDCVGGGQIRDGSVGSADVERTSFEDARMAPVVMFKAQGAGAAVCDTSPCEVVSGYNVASVTRNGVGSYTVSFAAPLSNNRYLTSCTALTARIIWTTSFSKNDFLVRMQDGTNMDADGRFSCVIWSD